MDEAFVNIVDVVPGAVQVPARDVRVGDSVFSTFGKPDRVIRVSKPGLRRVTITPETLWPLVVGPDDIVTILRGQDGATYESETGAERTTWNDVRRATAALDVAEASHAANPTDSASIVWEAARDALSETVRAYKAGGAHRRRDDRKA